MANIPSTSDPDLRTASSTICVAITAQTAGELFNASSRLAAEFPFQELRLDSLPEPAVALPALRAHVSALPEATFLATCRRQLSGGTFAGSPGEEHSLLEAAARAGCRLVDLSLESAEVLGTPSVHGLRQAGARVVLSWHDFTHTPDLQPVLARMRPFDPDIYKLVPTANRLRDNLHVLHLLPRGAPDLHPRCLVTLAMGEAGIPSRVLAVRSGAAFTFAAPAAGSATAPGQITAPVLRDLYRHADLDASTRVYGVAGDPVRSSLSPRMQNTAFAATDTNAVYIPLLTRDADDLFALARELPLDGFSVTMPLKQAVIPHLTRLHPLAARVGAVNTVRRCADGGFEGFNTDIDGIVAPLERRLPLRGARVLVIGAGGAARAAVFGCADRGAAVSILNRSPGAAEKLAAEAGASVLARTELLAGGPFDVLIHATPAGMRGNPGDLPLEAHELNARIVFDLVYNPLETPLIRLARAQQLDTICGLEMFIQQGARQFELWTGQPAPADAMETAVRSALA